jgi:hypothetical protein
VGAQVGQPLQGGATRNNLLLDTGTVAVISGIPISAGSLSFLSILLKFALTISAALLLIATTSFPGVCHALRRLGLPPALRKISPCGRNDEGSVFSKWLKKGSSDLIVLV